MQAKIGELWLQTRITVSFQYAILCVQCTTQKLPLVNGRSIYQMTALLPEIPISGLELYVR